MQYKAEFFSLPDENILDLVKKIESACRRQTIWDFKIGASLCKCKETLHEKKEKMTMAIFSLPFLLCYQM